MAHFGIDISKWQGDFDITEAKNEGVEFVILKVGGGDRGLYKDAQFENNYHKCKQNNLPVGCYFYGCAMTVDEAYEEAEYCCSLLEGHWFDLPIFYDVEGKMLNTDKDELTQIVRAFCSTVKSKGNGVGIYSSESVFNNKLIDEELAEFYHWVAKWSSNKPLLKSGSVIDIWQFGGETNFIRSNHIAGKVVDQNYCYLNLKTHKEPLKSDTVIASEILAGKWGNGAERKRRLEEAGYDYNRIQKLVNNYFSNKNKKSIEQIVLEVIRGEWGNNPQRRNRLEEAGYDYEEVQELVNSMLRC